MISRSNYEIFFVDYFDGSLDQNRQDELFLFLEENPDLKAEFERFENITVNPDTDALFLNKDKLKKDSPTHSNYKTWLIAELEGDLSKEKISELNDFLKKHPELGDERKLFRKTIITPEPIVFEGKQQLKKAVVLSFRKFTIAVSVAAAIAVFVLGYLFIYQPPSNERVISQKQAPKIEEKQIARDDAEQKDYVLPQTNTATQKNKENKSHQVKPDKVKKAPAIQPPVEIVTGLAKTEATSDSIEQGNLANVETDSMPIHVHVSGDKMALKQEVKKMSLADVFDENEIKELEDNISSKQVNITSFALREVEEASGIIVRKDRKQTATTYALSVKNVFRISHTVSE